VVNLDEGVIERPESLEIVSFPAQPVAVFNDAVRSFMTRPSRWQLDMYACLF